MDWTSYFRQLFLCTGQWTLYFMNGLCAGFPTVLVPQLKRANYTIGIKETSRLASLHVYSGIPWALILSVLIIIIGRKKAHIIVCSSTLIGFITFYFSTNINHFFIGEIFQGALSAAYMTTSIVILTECTSSKHRGEFLTIKSATFFWGILVANAIGTFFYWKYIVILGLVCSIYALFSVIIWPESPLWLATKGKFVECSAAHRWLKGNGEESEKELKKLINSYEKAKFVKQQWGVRYFILTITRKQFLKPVLLSNLLVCLYSFSGKLVCTVYALDIFKEISSNESTVYSGMLILDGVTIVSMYLGCALSKLLRRRVILIGFTSIGIVVMIIISIYLYLANLRVIEENKYVSIFLLATYSVTISCGPMIMCTTIIGELLPLESRILSLVMIALTFKLTSGTFALVSPLCFKYFGIHGTFLLYAILSFACLILVYCYIPETKDKTLQEIDECLKGRETIAVEEYNELMDLNSSKP